ncbi:MAG: hypothetical protein V4564_14090 [Pseudomonadota bacterium]|uniref:hypothetical protein n=1 Tax=Sphingomonas sp. ERG5 TaxID=1381597 RepID=UPI00054B1F99|nr:hypothetical protein [Sphingomonas sp. ERG5]
MNRIVMLTIATLLLSACDGGVPKDAQKTADALTGDAKSAAADNPICKLFTPGELEAYSGAPLNSGTNAGTGLACQWTVKVGEGDVMVTIAPARYAETPSLADGFRKVPGIGTDGYVVKEMGGWAAGAVNGKDYVKVSISETNATDVKAIALLKETLARHR